jgi:REP element-mobilizing transposase RayT
MARRLRIEYPGAIHHVINRGNYRRDLFESVGAAEAFLATLFQAADQFGWQVHAYVLMRNHFHLAVETPEPTLGEGMHWLQSSIATRFNRLRAESGHLFQGRYQALLIEDITALSRVVNYIHLNPVRAKVVLPEQVTGYRWSSLAALLKGPRPASLKARDWLSAIGDWSDNDAGHRAYADYLHKLALDEAAWKREGLVGLAQGWAIGTLAWRRALAKEHAARALTSGLPGAERMELRQASWHTALTHQLAHLDRTSSDLKTKPMKQSWKIELAGEIRHKTGASIPWLAEHLHLGGAATLRGYLHQAKRAKK